MTTRDKTLQDFARLGWLWRGPYSDIDEYTAKSNGKPQKQLIKVKYTMISKGDHIKSRVGNVIPLLGSKVTRKYKGMVVYAHNNIQPILKKNCYIPD